MTVANTPNPIIIDTDMAADDWMAILYLLQSPLAEVKAITLAATGEAHTRPGINIGCRLLKLASKEGIPVTTGRSKPLKGNNTFPLAWRLAVDARLGLRLPGTKQKRDQATAVELMIQQLSTAVTPITIVALGPLTNLGELLQTRPDLKENIAHIAIMGGALAVPGNIQAPGVRIRNPHAEWNIFVDPVAANIVFASGIPVSLVPLDATNKTPLTLAFYEKVAADHTNPAAEFVYRLLKRLKNLIGRHQYYFWDPLTAVITTHPHIAQFTSYPVCVIEDEGPTCGRTARSENGPPIHICTGVDQTIFETIFLETLNGRSIKKT